MSKNVIIQPDEENNGEEFWDALDDVECESLSDGAQAAIGALSCRADEVSVTKDVADELLEVFRALPGWSDGPEYAPHPLLFSLEASS